MKEALFYSRVAGSESRVQCRLCPHNCSIADGKRGLCGVRENRSGTLYSLVYGKVAAASIDPIEKKPLFHFLPGSASYSISTAGCNFRCDFCQNFGLSQPPRETGEIPGRERSPEQIVAAAAESRCQSIAYTYTEPTVYFEFAYDTAKLARARGLKNVFVSNGYMNPPVAEMAGPYLDAANIDLKSFRDATYRRVCGGKLAPVLETLKLMKKLGVWLEVTTLVIPGLNDLPEELAEIARFIKSELSAGTPWHVSGFYPAYKMLDRPRTPAESLARAREIGLGEGLKSVYAGNLPIKGAEDTYCPKCGQLVIRRSGFEVLENRVKDGKCGFCNEPIAGIWS
ncbi:MAG: AmmeMemoRadiSam system radical SAM enzyme [Candidatus Saganbacteria bacterium]|nr:AmmeMemoRadiSam system radical SAM enzyme [Candidatus Saganbacteria bacterium]